MIHASSWAAPHEWKVLAEGLPLSTICHMHDGCWGLFQVTKAALKPLDLQQTKDIETAVAGIRADKLKEKTAADAAKKGAPPLR